MENNGTNQQDSSASNNPEHDRSGQIKPGRALLLLIAYFFAGMFIGQFLGVLLAMGLFGIGWNQVLILAESATTEPNAKYILYCLQFGSAVGGFIAAPLLYLRRFENRSFSDFINQKSQHIIPLALTVGITLSFMIVNSILIEWNANISLPGGWEHVEQYLQEQEERMNELTEYLTTFESFQDFLLAMLVVAVIPAIGEELLFRGLIQEKMTGIFRNPHVAIWLTAFLFSAIHFQFYGLFPRLFLGAIFGYLYYWSGSLLLPMVAHFVNNGFSLLMYYLYQRDIVEFDVAETSGLSNSYIIVFLLLGVVCFGAYRRYFQQNNVAVHE